MNSKGMEMPVSESDKLEASVLGSRFSEKAEHLPIKKRRFLFRTSSPPLDTESSEGTEKVSVCSHSSSQEVQPKPDASGPPAASLTIDDSCRPGSIDSKVDGEKFVKTSKEASDNENMCGTSLVALAPCSNDLGVDADVGEGSRIVSYGMKNIEALDTVKVEAVVNVSSMSAKETSFHISAAPSNSVTSTMDCSSQDKAKVDNSTRDESALDNSCSHVPSESQTCKTQNSAPLDDRLNWDLNTVMDAWEDPLKCSNITYAEGKNSCKEGTSEDCEPGHECRSATGNIGDENLPVLKSLARTIDEPEQEERKPGSNDINKLSPPVNFSAPHVAVKKIKFLQNQHLYSSSDAIPAAVPSIVKLEHPTCNVSAKHVNVNCKSSSDLSCPVAAGLEFSLNCPIPPGFVHGINMRPSDKNVVASPITNHAITTLQKNENDKLNLSLVTAASQETRVHQSEKTFDEDDKAQVKRAITSNRVIMENLSGKGSESSQDANKEDGKALNQTIQLSGLVKDEDQDQPTAVPLVPNVVCSDAEVTIKTEQIPVTATSGESLTQLTGTINQISHESHTDFPKDNKDVCKVHLDSGFDFENPPSDIQAGSEVENVDEFFVGCDSQVEDGEVKESSIQTWEGSEGEEREDGHGTDNRGTSLHLGNSGTHENGSQCEPESSLRTRSTDVGSQRGADEISSVSGSGPNETTREVTVKDASQSDQWKMNVSGSEIQSSVNNVSSMRNLSSIKCSRIERYGSETEDLETKAEGPRFYRREPLSFLDRGRLRTQGCSSSNADDSAFISVRESGVLRSIRQGNYSSHIPARGRGRGTWNRSLLEDGIDPNEVGVNPNEVGRPGASSYVTHQCSRSRLLANREEDAFRARLGLRPSGDTGNNRFLNVGRGRSLRYGSRHNGGGPRRQYYGPPSDDCNQPSMEFSHSFPVRRRCFSPTERRENHPCAHHQSGSTSPPMSRTRSPISDGFRRRSRSPNLRSDTRIRRPRSPNFRHDFEADHAVGYNMEPRNNNSPPGTRWVKYKQRSTVFERRSPPPGIGERLTFYDSSRKPKQNESYRSGHPGRFSELHGTGRGGPRYMGGDGDPPDHGYRRGGFVRRYGMGRPVKHIKYDEEDGYGPVYDSRNKDNLEFHGRGNPKPYNNGPDGRFRDLSKRPRGERELMISNQRRVREEKAPITDDPKEA